MTCQRPPSPTVLPRGRPSDSRGDSTEGRSHSDTPVAMQWKPREWTRRLRTAERLICAANIAEFQPKEPKRLAPRRLEPPRSGETWQDAELRAGRVQAEEFRQSVADPESLKAHFCFEDDPLFQVLSSSDEEEPAQGEQERRRAEAEWWRTEAYVRGRTKAREESAVEEVDNIRKIKKVALRWLTRTRESGPARVTALRRDDDPDHLTPKSVAWK